MYSHKKFYKLILLFLELFTPWCVGTCVVLSLSCLLCVDTCSGGVSRVRSRCCYSNMCVSYLKCVCMCWIWSPFSQDLGNPQSVGVGCLPGKCVRFASDRHFRNSSSMCLSSFLSSVSISCNLSLSSKSIFCSAVLSCCNSLWRKEYSRMCYPLDCAQHTVATTSRC